MPLPRVHDDRMLRGFVLRYLAAIAEGQSFAEARDALPALVRGPASRRARRIVATVMLASARADDAAHVHRVAYLVALGREPASPDDVAAVAEAFGRQRDPARERRAPLVLAASVTTGALALLGALAGYRALTAPAPRYVLPPPVADLPQPVTAAPARDTAPHPLTHVFAERLPAWVVALDARSAGRDADVESARNSVLSALAAHGGSTELASAMRVFLEAAERHVAAAGDDGGAHVTRALLGLDDALARESAPFYVDAILTESLVSGRRRVLVTSFRVRARRLFESPCADPPRRVTSLDLERIDALSFEQTLLGYTRPDVRYALVLTARVESFLVGSALPAMASADEAVLVHGYEDERDAGWVKRFEQAVHEVLREDALRMADRAAVDALAFAAMRRRRAFETASRELDAFGLRLRAPETYALDLAHVEPVMDRLASETRRELREAQAGLEQPALGAAFRAIEERYLLSIARHEAQHRLDYEDDRLVRVPDALAAYTGRTESEDRPNLLAERANAELSAYLSQIAREPERSKSHLVFVSRFVMNRDAWGMPEAYAAVVIFETLARELGLSPAPLIVAGRIARGEIARLFLAVRTSTGEQLSAAAQRAWHALYGVPLGPLSLAQVH